MSVDTDVTLEQAGLRQALAQVLGCPRCEGRLELEDASSRVRCAACGGAFPVRDGIPVFTLEGSGSQEGERAFRDRLAADHVATERGALLETVAEHHCVPVMRQRATAFASRSDATDWLLDVGIGWGWHWMGRSTGARVLGVDMSLGSLRLARRLLGKTDRVVLLCADATALPLRHRSVTGLWSVQAFQHMPERVLERATAELDRTLRDDFRMEISNLNPALAHRIIYRLAGRRLHRQGRVGEMELSRRTGREWAAVWRDFRGARSRVFVGYSELFFHPDLGVRPREYPLRLERALARVPAIARLIARQVDVRVESGSGG